MSNDPLINLYSNPNSILLVHIRINWKWIFLIHNSFLISKTNASINTIAEICEPSGISGSNINNNCRLIITCYTPAAINYLKEISNEIINIINEFFKLKIITSVRIVSSWG